MRHAFLSFVAAFAVGCGGSPAGPDAHGLTGTFTGTAQDQAAGSGTVEASLTESYGALTGTWNVTGAGFAQKSYHVSGSIFSDNTLDFKLCEGVCYEIDDPTTGAQQSAGGGPCTYRIKGRIDGDRITGNYSLPDSCPSHRSGSVSLSRK